MVRRTMFGGVGLMLVLALCGVAQAAELKVEASTEGAGDGLVANSDGIALIQVLVTRYGTSVQSLSRSNFIIRVLRKPYGSCTPVVNQFSSGFQNRDGGYYQLALADVVSGGAVCGTGETQGWKKGVYVLGIQGLAPIKNSLGQIIGYDNGMTLAELRIQ